MRGNQFTHDGNGDVPWCFLHEESEFACGDNAVHVSNRKCFVVIVLSGRFQFIVVAWDYSDVIDLVRADDQFSVGPICSRNERNILFIPLRCQPGFDNSPHYLLTALRDPTMKVTLPSGSSLHNISILGKRWKALAKHPSRRWTPVLYVPKTL